MHSKLLFLTILLTVTQAFAGGPVDDLWHKLKRDFDSKPYFFNDSLNDQRTGVMSPFIKILNGESATNNALPLSPKQLKNLPNARFLDQAPFALAMAGRERLIKAGKIKNLPIMAIADFSKNSRFRRFYIMDLEKGEVLINTWVSHAYASDINRDGYPETFSNMSGSNMSSVGFMVTDATYSGTYGYSQRLKGLDPVLNTKVLARAVVIHGFGGLGAQQLSYGVASTSEGCLMFSTNESGLFWGMEDKSMLELVIKTLRSGALVFTYTDETDAQEKPLIFKSQWIKPSDLPVEEVEPEETPKPIINNDYNPNVEVVSHAPNQVILNARPR